MKRYPDEVAEYISAHVEGMTTKQLTSDLNNIFAHKYNLNFTEAKIKSYKTNHGLKSKTKGGMPKGFSKVYPDGMEDFVRSIANGKTTKELTEAVNEKYGAGTITAKKMRAYKKNHNIVSGIDCKFQPGHIPANKGKPMSPEQYEKCKETMFKKGQIPPNHINVGEYTHTTDGYLIRKIRETGTQRERLGVPTQEFKTCFICGRHLAMNRIPIVISVSGKGNRFACDKCYEKSQREKEHEKTEL